MFSTYQLFSALPIEAFLLLNLAMMIYYILILALTMLASALFRNAIAAGGVAFAGFLALSILPALNANVAQALSSIFFSPERLAPVLAGNASAASVLWPLAVGLGLALAFVILACLVFQRQEL